MTTDHSNANKASDEAAKKEAIQYWGYMIKEDKCGTETLDRLLKGIAEVISRHFEPGDCPDISPSQLAAFYRAVGGNYDVLFIETPPSSISFIYRSLGAFHSLQPAPDDEGYTAPTIPSLKRKGFVTWQTIQLLLGPEEHVPFLQRAVAQFDVVDPDTGAVFPKILPSECFPDKPDDAMEAWYEGVAEKLRNEAEEDAVEKDHLARARVEVDEAGPRTSSEEGSADDRHSAARYFDDPLYRKAKGTRPTFVRHTSRTGPRQYVEDRGRSVANSVRHLLNPFKQKKPGRHSDDDYSDEDATPVAPGPPALRYTHKRPHVPRRESSLSSTDSGSDTDGPPSRRRTPVVRRRRSHDPPVSPREYFPPVYEERRYSHDQGAPSPEYRKQDGPPPVYGPTKSPLFATHVAQIQQANNSNYYDRRTLVPPPRSSPYRPQAAVRYSSKPNSPRESDQPYHREREGHEASGSSTSSRARRRSYEDTRSSRESRDSKESRDRTDSSRVKSHDRLKDEWDARERSRERDRDWDRDRDRDRDRDARPRTHRYVAGVDGVGGRKYPIDQPWR